jgi:hypothetical protein
MNHPIADEPEEDSALRAELQGMLGIEATHPADSGATADATALAQSLHREAMRRRRTSAGPRGQKGRVRPILGRPLLVALAAAVPIAVTFTALGAWGVGQKQRADALAAKTAELESRQSRMEEAMEAAKAKEAKEIREAPPALHASEQNLATHRSGELVKPEERPERPNNTNGQYRVKDRR